MQFGANRSTKNVHILDVGAGSGRDAAWFEQHGHEVVACEPSAAMRREAQILHPDSRVRWLSDSLPDLTTLSRSVLVFDLILLSAVWVHLEPCLRLRAFRKLAALLAPKGMLVITLRNGPDQAGRGFHPVSETELEVIATRHGLVRIRSQQDEDHLDRGEVTWRTLVYQLPNDEAGSLPFIRSVIFRDSKSSTYKLGLLRVLCRIADQNPGIVKTASDESIELPLGLVALIWLRAHLPLVRARLPQHPQPANRFTTSLERLEELTPQDLRSGQRIKGGAAVALRASLEDAITLIRHGPAKYITYPGDAGLVFRLNLSRPSAAGNLGTLVLDEPTLWSYGSFLVPFDLWLTICRFASWIEPLLRQAWANYMEERGAADRNVDPWKTLEWIDPQRETGMVRAIAEGLQARGERLFCVWSGARLRDNLEIDHCFPMAAWPCQDLWNLVPSLPTVNRRKLDKLISAKCLENSKGRLLDWWDHAYVQAPETCLSERFLLEARMTLALNANQAPYLEDVLAGVDLKRMSLGRNRELEIWDWNGAAEANVRRQCDNSAPA